MNEFHFSKNNWKILNALNIAKKLLKYVKNYTSSRKFYDIVFYDIIYGENFKYIF